MATALFLSTWRSRIPQELRRLHLRHYGGVHQLRDSEVKIHYQGFKSRSYDDSSRGRGFLKNLWKDPKTQEFHTLTSTRSGLANGVRLIESPQSERIVFGLSLVGRQVLLDIRQMFRVAGDSMLSMRADVNSQGQKARQFLAECGYPHTGERQMLPQLGKVLKVASLFYARHQVAPQTLAVIVGNASLAHQSTAHTAQFPGVDGQNREGITAELFGVTLLLSLIEGFMVIARAAYLAALFSPVLILAPFVQVFRGQFRENWFQLVHRTLELAGAAFIKWGQWAATRPDLFPRDLCFHLTKLHSKAPAHDFAQTQKTVEGAFGRKLDEIFEDFEQEPMASGSIGQVHKAVLRFRNPGQNSKSLTVAVKVRHPGVTEVIRRDFIIINWMAKVSTVVPGLRWLKLDESLKQFAVFMMSQVDLAKEAAHLSRFIYNFRKWKDVSFPKPLYPLVHPEVLVETFEPGKSVAHYVDLQEATKLNKGLADIGTNALLKMLLVDNFIHADMHPGNILVQTNNSHQGFFKSRPHIILLDVGMTVELSQKDRLTLLEFFKGIATKKGRTVAECTLQFSHPQNCPDPEAFKDAIENIFDEWSREEGPGGLHAGECIQELLEQVRLHKVSIHGNICSVMVTTLVLEGWQRKLDPDLNMITTLQTMLFQSDWVSSISYTMDGLMGP